MPAHDGPGAASAQGFADDQRLYEAARSIVQDPLHAELADRFAEAAIPFIVLKGATFARWLYTDGTVRPSIDTDILVSRRRFREAGRVLRRAGFEPDRLVVTWQHEHASTWFRQRDQAQVDLHHLLTSLDRAVDPWPVLVRHTELFDVGGQTLTGLDEPARCLHVALHAKKVPGQAKTMEDLERALATADPASWEVAVELADTLRCTAELAEGLRLVEDGALLADRLGIGGLRSTRVAARSLVGPARLRSRIVVQRTARGRAALIVSGLFPAPLVLRRRYPWASGRRVSLAYAVDLVRRVRLLASAAHGQVRRTSST